MDHIIEGFLKVFQINYTFKYYKVELLWFALLHLNRKKHVQSAHTLFIFGATTPSFEF